MPLRALSVVLSQRVFAYSAIACSVLALAVLAFDGSTVRAQQPGTPASETPQSLKKIVGSYSIRSGASGGQDLPKDRLADVTVKITEQTITTYDGTKQERFNASYQLSTDKRPWRITMTSIPKSIQNSNTSSDPPKKAQTTVGLVELSEDGQKLKLIYALPGGEPPKDFKAGKQQNLFELQRLETQKQ